MDVSRKIAELRKATGLSQYRLAKLSGVHPSAISRYEAGSLDPGPRILERLCRGLGITLAEFYTEEQTPDEKPDYDIRVIERARRRMSDVERMKMMRILRASFGRYFEGSE